MNVQQAPKYSLDKLKIAFCAIDRLTMTRTAMQSRYDLGFSYQDVVDAIQALTDADFYKSMPPKDDSFSAWHDVYKSTFNGVKLYIKFQIDKRGEMIISFKAR